MEIKLFLAFCGEGKTDERFFINLTERIIEEHLLEINVNAVIDWLPPIPKTGTSAETIIRAAQAAKRQSLLVLHRDADCTSRAECIKTHFEEGLTAVGNLKTTQACNEIVLAIPVQETEAWMLADKELLKELMATDLSNQDLELTYAYKNIESIRDPKSIIKKAITIHRAHIPPKKRRNAIEIAELYEGYSGEVELETLSGLESFQQFRNQLIDTIGSILQASHPA